MSILKRFFGGEDDEDRVEPFSAEPLDDEDDEDGDVEIIKDARRTIQAQSCELLESLEALKKIDKLMVADNGIAKSRSK